MTAYQPVGPLARPRVVVVSVQGRPGLHPASLARLEHLADVTTVARGDAPPLTADQARRVLAGADVAALTPKVAPVVDDALLAELPGLSAVALHATGTDLFEHDVFARAGVALAALPDYSTVSVAEHALAMLFSLSRRVHLANDRSRALVPADTSLRGFELSGRTLGIVGLGLIGSHVARVAAALGMRVIAHDPRLRSTDGHVPLLALPDVLRRSDALVVACSRRHGAPPLLGKDELSLLPVGASVVVVSRAAVVDTGAVVALVRSGHLRGYAVDDVVLDPALDGDLLREGRVVQTGHSAWWSDEVLERGARLWVESMIGLVEGRPASLAVDPPGWAPWWLQRGQRTGS